MTEQPTPPPETADVPTDGAVADAAAAETPPAAQPTALTVKDGASPAGDPRKSPLPLTLPQFGAGWAVVRERLGLRRPRLRLVPAIIFVAVLMLGVRVGDLWEQMVLALERPIEPPSIAFAPTGDSDEDSAGIGSLVPTAAAQDEAAAPHTPPAAEPGLEVAEAPADAEVAGPPADPDADPAVALSDVDPRDMSPVELEMLRGLSRRRADLEAREGELDQREALLEVAEQRMAETMAELEALRSEIEGLLGQADARREEQLVSLVRMYEAMRPADAAAIFDGLELEVLLNVLERMREAKAAPIVAGMTPERAREVTSELALRQAPEIPDSE